MQDNIIVTILPDTKILDYQSFAQLLPLSIGKYSINLVVHLIMIWYMHVHKNTALWYFVGYIVVFRN